MSKDNHGLSIGGVIALSAVVSAATAVATYFATKKVLELREEKYYDAFCDGDCEHCDDEECKCGGEDMGVSFNDEKPEEEPASTEEKPADGEAEE